VHQAGRVTYAFDILPARRDPDIVEIGTHKNNSGTRGRGSDAHMNTSAMVEACAGNLDWTA